MTVPQALSDDDLLSAASLAFAMLRFEGEAAHSSGAHTPQGRPRLGIDAYRFFPGGQVLAADVPRFLADLPSPAVLVPTTTRGLVALILLDELREDRASRIQPELTNQQAGLEEMAAQIGLSATSRILLEFSGETIVQPLTVLRVWAQRFAVVVGWSIAPLKDDPRASARLNLFRSDGVNTAGAKFLRE